jgi:hypothetical protein
MILNRKALRKMILKEMAEMQSPFSYEVNVDNEYGETIVFLEMRVGEEDASIAFSTPLEITDLDLENILEGAFGPDIDSHHVDATETSQNAGEFLLRHKALIQPHVKHIVADILELDLEEPDHLGYYPDAY